MRALHRLALVSLPLAFGLAGTGMLWLLRFEGAPGTFFERLEGYPNDWIGAHLILLLSTVFLTPAAVGICLASHQKMGRTIATLLLLVVALTSVLLAGQYAIDFLMPLLVEVGGEALNVHPLLFDTPIIDTLFYKLPNLVFLALFFLSCTLFWVRGISRSVRVILLVNWLMVLLGNLIDPVFQRASILLLAFSFLPFVHLYWNKTNVR